MLVIDGSQLEGGGQIIRNSMSYACILNKQISIKNIRSGRPKPGLKSQHSTGLHLASLLSTSSILTNNTINSSNITFIPGNLEDNQNNHFKSIINTAGAITLLVQISLPVLLFMPNFEHSVVEYGGGSNVPFAPHIDYTVHVLKPVLEMFGVDIEIDVKNRGFMPSGGGLVSLKPINLTNPGTITKICGRIWVSGPKKTDKEGSIMLQTVLSTITQHLPSPNTISLDITFARDPPSKGGSAGGIILWTESTTSSRLGSSSLLEKCPKKAARNAVLRLFEFIDGYGCVDEYLQDQLVIFMTLAKGRSSFLTGVVSLHTETAIEVARLLTGVVFEVTRTFEGLFLVECEGIGFSSAKCTEDIVDCS